MDQGFESWCDGSGFTDAQRAALRDLGGVFETFNEAVPVAGELSSVMAAADRARAVVDGHVTVLTGRFDQSADWALDRHKSPTSWFQGHTHVSTGKVHGVLARSRVLRECPHATEAFVAGRLSECKVRYLLEVRRPEVIDAWIAEEPDLCAAIEPLRVSAARRYLLAWYFETLEKLRINEPDSFTPPSPRSVLRLVETMGGRHVIDGELTDEDSAIVNKAVDDLISTWRREGTLTPEDERSWDELRADAVVELVSRGAGHANPRSASVIAVIDVDTLMGRAPDAGSMDFRSDLAGQGPINPDTIRRLACNAAIHPIFHRGGHEILDVGRSQRLATDAIRRAVYTRSGGLCEVCHNARLTWCQVHHIEPWTAPDGSPGGDTSLENSLLVCSHCHHLLHEGRHSVKRTDEGFQLVNPDGTIPRARLDWQPCGRPPPGKERQPPPEPGWGEGGV